MQENIEESNDAYSPPDFNNDEGNQVEAYSPP